MTWISAEIRNGLVRVHKLVEQMKEAGVVGAGGAGFPAYVKFDATVEIMLANGAECEPLLSKDKELMLRFPEMVKQGMERTSEAVGASRRILGIKAKHHEAIGQFRRIFGNTGIEIFEITLVSSSTTPDLMFVPPRSIPM